MLKLKLQYFGHLIQTADSSENSLMLVKTEDRRRGRQDEMARWHHHCNEPELCQTSGHGKGQQGLVCCSPWGHEESDRTVELKNNNGINSFIPSFFEASPYSSP